MKINPPAPVEAVFVLRLSRYELTILTSVLVEYCDVITGELSFLRGDAFEEGKRLRDGFNGLLAKLMDLR
jgi:hypothetical protein